MNLKHNKGTVRDPIRVPTGVKITADELAEEVKLIAMQKEIPVSVHTDIVSEGGLFGKEYPCVVISHPNPPDSYFDQVIAICGESLYFYFFGYSKATTQANKRKMRKDSNNLLDNLVGAMMSDNTVALDTEDIWHSEVCQIYDELCE